MSSKSFQIDLPDLGRFIHQAALYPHLNEEGLNRICDTAKHLNFSGLCTNLIRIPTARKRLGTSCQTKLIAVISFPFGEMPSSIKRRQAEWAINEGAEELDIVPNYFALSQNKTNIFAEEISEISDLGLPTRVILDIGNLQKEKLSLAVDASIEAGVVGIQTGNGFGPTISKEQIKALSSLVRDRCSIKATGGVKTHTHAIELIQAGANQLGTSFGLELIQGLKEENKK